MHVLEHLLITQIQTQRYTNVKNRFGGIHMRLEHVAIFVEDLEGAKHFFVKYFGATSNDKYVNDKNGFSSYFLSFEDGARLELMSKKKVIRKALMTEGLGLHHLAFSVGSKQKVDEVTKALVAEGYKIILPPRVTGDGYYESSLFGFENLVIEVTI